MTFPVVESSNFGGNSSGSSTITASMPAGVVAGDLLLFFCGSESSVLQTTPPTGWTEKHASISGGRSYYVYARVATGDASDAFVYVRPNTANFSYVNYRISGAYATLDGFEGTFLYDSGNFTPTSPEHTASWGSADNLWFAYWYRNGGAVPVYPADFTDNNVSSRNSGVYGTTVVGTRNFASATQASFAWPTMSTANGVGTFVVRPVAGSGSPPTVTVNPSNASVTEPGTANFTATATGATSLQWQYSADGGTTPLSVSGGTGGTTGTTSGSYTTGATATSSGDFRNGYLFRCAFTNGTGTVYSDWAALTVNPAVLTITSDPLRDEADNLLASTLIAKVAAIKLSNMELVHAWADATTEADGSLVVTSSALTSVPHILVTSSADGLDTGAKLYTPVV